MLKRILFAALLCASVPLAAQRTTVGIPYVAPGSGATSIAWSSTSPYQQGDVVSYSGYSYISLQFGNTGNTPSSGSAYWAPLGAYQAQPGTQAAITGVRFGNGSGADTVATPTQIQQALNDKTLNGQTFYTQSNTGTDTYATPPTTGAGLSYANGRLSYQNCTNGTCTPWAVLPETMADILADLLKLPGCSTAGNLVDPANGGCDTPSVGTLPSGAHNLIMATPDVNTASSGQVVLRAMTNADLPNAIQLGSISGYPYVGGISYVQACVVTDIGRVNLGPGSCSLVEPMNLTSNTSSSFAGNSGATNGTGGYPYGESWTLVNASAQYTWTITAPLSTCFLGAANGSVISTSSCTQSVPLTPGQKVEIMYQGQVLNAWLVR